MFSMLKKIYGEWLYTYRTLFVYPQNRIRASADHTYDDYWQKRRGGKPRAITSWQKARVDLVLEELAGEKDLSVGDIGCGEGTILKYLQEKSPAIVEVMGYDSSPLAREWAAALGVPVSPLDLHAPDWTDSIKECDYLLLMEMIEHVPNSEEVVTKALGKVRRGVFITVPNTGFILHRLRLLFGSFPAQWVAMPNEHLRFWTLRDMRWWLRALQFQHASVRGYRGVPILNRLWPGLFAVGLFISIRT